MWKSAFSDSVSSPIVTWPSNPEPVSRSKLCHATEVHVCAFDVARAKVEGTGPDLRRTFILGI